MERNEDKGGTAGGCRPVGGDRELNTKPRVCYVMVQLPPHQLFHSATQWPCVRSQYALLSALVVTASYTHLSEAVAAQLGISAHAAPEPASTLTSAAGHW